MTERVENVVIVLAPKFASAEPQSIQAMSLPTLSIGSRVVEVVINPTISKAVTLGKRRASIAFSRAGEHHIRASSAHNSSSDDDEYQGEDKEEEEEDTDLGSDEDDEGIQPGPSCLSTPKPRPYRCTHQGCTKSYTKPSRLAEHQRSHTGEVSIFRFPPSMLDIIDRNSQRPFACSVCSKSYLRESHLQAHSRSHLSASERPLGCSENGCTKRFWTNQHLSAHVAKVHHGEKPFTVRLRVVYAVFALTIFPAVLRRIL